MEARLEPFSSKILGLVNPHSNISRGFPSQIMSISLPSSVYGCILGIEIYFESSFPFNIFCNNLEI